MKNTVYYEHLKEILKNKIGPISMDVIENETINCFGDYFTQTLLLRVFNCPEKEFENSEFLISSCFYGGIITNLIYQNTDKTDLEYVGKIQSILELNLFHTEELLKTSIDVLGKVGWLEDIEKRKEVLLRQSLTHQLNVNETGLQLMLTTLYGIFMIAAAIELR